MNESIQTCVAYAESKAASYSRVSGLRVNIDALRKEGFTIEIAPPANETDFHQLKGQIKTKRSDPAVLAALEDLIRAHGYWPPFNAAKAFSTKHGVSQHSLTNALIYRRRKTGATKEAAA